MTDKLRAAAQAALNWLEGIKTQSVGEYMQVVDSLKTALAEPEQEPVAYIRVSKTGNVTACAMTGDFYKLTEKTLLYTAALVEPKQEPVGKFSKFSDEVWKEVTASSPGIFLYTAPPRKEWVGLTDEEKYDCYLKIDVWSRCVEAVEAKLKEKNGG